MPKFQWTERERPVNLETGEAEIRSGFAISAQGIEMWQTRADCSEEHAANTSGTSEQEKDDG